MASPNIRCNETVVYIDGNMFPKMRVAVGENIVPVVLCLDYIYTDHGSSVNHTGCPPPGGAAASMVYT